MKKTNQKICCLLSAVCCLLSAVCCLLSANAYGMLDESQVLTVTEILKPSIVYMEISAKIPDRDGNVNQKTFAKNGLIIDDKGYILTSYISDQIVSNIKVIIGKEEYIAKLTGNDKVTRIAVIKIETNDKLFPAKLSDKSVRLGEWLVGTYRLSEENQYRDVFFHSLVGGIIPVGIYDELYLNAIPTIDGVILANLTGEVCAIILPFYEISLPLLESPSAKLARDVTMMEATPKCITIKGIKDAARELISGNKSSKISWAGVQLKELSKDEAEGFGIPHEGVIITRVFKNSPAEKAGLLNNDILIEVNKNKIPEGTFGIALLIDLFRTQKIGVAVPLKIRRGSDEQSLSLTPVEVPEPKQIRNSNLGITVQEITDMAFNGLNLVTDTGVIVVESENASPADNADIKRGDVIFQAQNTQINNITDYENFMLKTEQLKDKNLLMKLYRGNKNLIRVIKTGQ